MHQLVETSGLPPSDRYEYWLDTLSRTAMPVRLRTEHTENFVASVGFTQLGSLGLMAMKQPAIDVERTPELIRQFDPETYHLVLNLSGHQVIAQERNEVALSPGELTLFTSTKPFRTRSGVGDGREHAIVLVIPAQLLPHRPAALRELLAVPLGRPDGLSALVSQHLHTLAANADQFDQDDLDRLSSITADLVSLLLARRLGTGNVLPPPVRQTALWQRVNTFIDDRLGDPGLSPSTVAVGNHMSVRSLHRLFEAHETTVTAWIRARRLDRCAQDLIDTRQSDQTIAAIAARWGFNDPTTFNRIFKTAFGLSPRSYRIHHRVAG